MILQKAVKSKLSPL